jgi:hypothetical protein
MLTLPKSALKAIEVKGKPAAEPDKPLWEPHPDNKPQIEAFSSPADRLFYGGKAGGG